MQNSTSIRQNPSQNIKLSATATITVPSTQEQKETRMISITLSLFFTLILVSHSHQTPELHCNETCNGIQISFPFYLNKSSCGWSNPASQFQLLCINSTSLYLSIGTQNYPVLDLYSDGLLVDFPGISRVCRPYNDFNSFGFSGNPYLSISSDNIIGLYDCEDSSLCSTDCEGVDLPGCSKNGGNDPSCCYPLSDNSVWRIGDSLSVFEKYECRGFSSWEVSKGRSFGRRGIKLEWALPRNLSKEACHGNAHIVNATAVKDGVRCVCDDGFSGDGFANGTGCFISCLKNGEEAYGKDCEEKKHTSKRTLIILVASISAAAFVATLAYLLMLWCRNRAVKEAHKGSRFSFKRAIRSRRLFTTTELEQATDGFSEDRKLIELNNGSVYTGSLEDGSRVAVHRVNCHNEKDLLQVHTQIDLLSTVLHRHMARVIGCCRIDSGYNPMVVYEYPENGTLAQHIRIPKSTTTTPALDWYKRLTIAAQTANTLAFLQHEISTPVYHCNLNTSCVFLDCKFSAKLACFELISPHKSDVYDLGVVLLEIISGSKHHTDSPAVSLEKIRDGKLEEIVDPLLCFLDHPLYKKEQIETMADVAARCLQLGNSEKMKMVDVARELDHLRAKKGPGITIEEETDISHSSLLQMASLSPQYSTSESESAYFTLPFNKHIK